MLFIVNQTCLNICDKTDFWKSHIQFENDGAFLKRGPQYNPKDSYNDRCLKLTRNISCLIKNLRLNNNQLIIKLNDSLFPKCNNTQFAFIIKWKSIENTNDIVNNSYDNVSKNCFNLI